MECYGEVLIAEEAAVKKAIPASALLPPPKKSIGKGGFQEVAVAEQSGQECNNSQQPLRRWIGPLWDRPWGAGRGFKQGESTRAALKVKAIFCARANEWV